MRDIVVTAAHICIGGAARHAHRIGQSTLERPALCAVSVRPVRDPLFPATFSYAGSRGDVILAFRRGKSAVEDIIEGVEVVPPLGPGINTRLTTP